MPSMMDLENAIKVALQITDTNTVDEAIQAMERLGREVGKTEDEIRQSTQALRYYQEITKEADASVDAMVESQIELNRSMAIAKQITQDAKQEQLGLKTTTTDTTKANSEMARGLLQTSYAVQDFTSQLGTRGLAGALGAVQNNIPGILTSLGAGAGLAGTISLVSVGLGIVIPQLMEYAGATDAAAEATKKLADEADRIKNQRTPEQQGTAGLIGDYLKSSGKQVAGGIQTALQLEAEGTRTPEEEAFMGPLVDEGRDKSPWAVAKQAMLDPMGFAKAMRSRANRPQAIEADSNRLLTGLGTDLQARNRVRQLAAKHPSLFPTNFGEFLAEAEPEAIEAQNKESDAEAERMEAMAQRAKAMGEKRRQAARDQRMKRSRVERNLDKRTADDLMNEESLKQDEERELQDRLREAAQITAAEAEKNREKEREAREAAQKAREEARAKDPTNVMQRDAAALQDSIATEAMRQGRGVNANPFEVQAIAREAAGNLPAVGGDIAEAVRMAVQQVYAKVQADLQAQAQEIMGMGADVSSVMPGYPPYMRRVR